MSYRKVRSARTGFAALVVVVLAVGFCGDAVAPRSAGTNALLGRSEISDVAWAWWELENGKTAGCLIRMNEVA